MKIPENIPSPKTPEPGYQWVYRGMGWSGERCDYCVYREGKSFTYYKKEKSRPGGYGDSHYFELVKNNNLSIEEKIELAKSMVGKQVKFSYKDKDEVYHTEVKSWHITDTIPSGLFTDSLCGKYLKDNVVCVYVILKDGKYIPVDDSGLEVILKPEYTEVDLNSDYTAKVYKDKIEVGCQTFPISILNDLSAAHKEVSE